MGGFSYTWSRLEGNYSGLASSDEYEPDGTGRNSPNVELFFDTWYLAFDKSLGLIDGPLATDRPHVFKLYGSYSFPIGLTVGAMMQAMSGVPRTEYWIVDGNYMPYNRGNLGRTPSLFYANFYAEYSLRLGRNRLAFSINIDNFLDANTTLVYFPYRTLYNLTVTEDQLLSGEWELETSGYVPNAMFNLPAIFYKPISARLGMRFSF